MKHIARILICCLTLVMLCTTPKMEVQAASTDPFVIVLDPGHDDGQSRGTNKISGIVEDDVNLAIAKALKKDLEKKGFTVYLTRSDTACPAGSGASSTQCLNYRVNYAKACGCDLFISLHVNASGGNSGTWRSSNGSSVFMCNYSKYKSSMTELASDISSSLKSSCGLAERTPKGTVKKTEDGITYGDGNAADFYRVLRESTYQGFPSILIEHFFMDNKNDVAIYKKQGAYGLAAADCAGIVKWYKSQYGSLPSQGSIGYVNSEKLNVRSGAGTSKSIVGTLKQNDTVVIMGSTSGWYYVIGKHGSSRYKGYVKATYITKGIHSVTKYSASSGTSSGTTKNTGSYTAGYVNYYFLNLRKSAGTGSAIVCRLDQYDTLKLYSYSNQWYKVDAVHNGKTYSGYVKGSYVAKGTPKSSTTSKSTSGYTTAAYVSNDILNLRSEPNTSSKKIVQLTQYDTLMLGTKSNGWYPAQALHNGKTYTGYVKADYLKTGNVGYVNYTYLNVRQKPGTSNRKIDELSKKDTVVIVGTSGGWYQIKYVKNGKVKTGYVLSSYITLK